jgi:hypothetical protein
LVDACTAMRQRLAESLDGLLEIHRDATLHRASPNIQGSVRDLNNLLSAAQTMAKWAGEHVPTSTPGTGLPGTGAIHAFARTRSRQADRASH